MNTNQALLNIIKQLTIIYNSLVKKINMTQVTTLTNRELFFKVAQGFVGRDASPSDVAPDEYGCMETIDNIHKAAFGTYIDLFRYSVQISTYRGYSDLKNSPLFKEIKEEEALPGDLCIFPSGYGRSKSPIQNGHILMVGENKTLYSNDSPTGKFIQNYTFETARQRWVVKGGYPMKFYRRV